MTSISIGPATTILQNVVYALPAKLVFITSTLAVQSSINGTDWIAVTDAETTGSVLNSVFLRCTTGNAIVVCHAANVEITFNIDSIPTSALLQVAGLGISTPAIENQVTFNDGVFISSLSPTDLTIATIAEVIIDADSLTLAQETTRLVFANGASIDEADPFVLRLNGGVTVDGDAFLGSVGGINLVTPGTITADSGDLTLSTTTSGGIDLVTAQPGGVGGAELHLEDGSTGGGSALLFGGSELGGIGGDVTIYPGAGTTGGSVILKDSLGVDILTITNGAAEFGANIVAGGAPGINTTVTTASLVGKTITITKGIITGFA